MNAIFISFDENHLHYAKSFFNSIKHNYKNHPVILVDYMGCSEKTQSYLDNMDNVRRISLQKSYNFRLGAVQSNVVFQRFNLWSSQFDDYEKILHLDVDIIVLKPLDHIFAKEEFYICSDYNDDAKLFLDDRDPFLIEALADDGLVIEDSLSAMANAGVFLIPKKYRSLSEYNALIAIANKYHAYAAFADQTIISLWCHFSKIKFSLDFFDNCQIRMLANPNIQFEADSVALLHFSGEAKFKNKSFHLFGDAQELLDIYEAAHQYRLFYRRPRQDFEDISRLKLDLYSARESYLERNLT